MCQWAHAKIIHPNDRWVISTAISHQATDTISFSGGQSHDPPYSLIFLKYFCCLYSNRDSLRATGEREQHWNWAQSAVVGTLNYYMECTLYQVDYQGAPWTILLCLWGIFQQRKWILANQWQSHDFALLGKNIVNIGLCEIAIVQFMINVFFQVSWQATYIWTHFHQPIHFKVYLCWCRSAIHQLTAQVRFLLSLGRCPPGMCLTVNQETHTSSFYGLDSA